MDQRTLYTKAIRYQKTGVDVFFNLLSTVQEGSQTMAAQALEQSSWIPQASRKSCVSWFEECAKTTDVMKDFVDKGYSGLDQFWPFDGEKKAKSSSPVSGSKKEGVVKKSSASTFSKNPDEADKPKAANMKSAAKSTAAKKKAASRKTIATKAAPKKKAAPRKTTQEAKVEVKPVEEKATDATKLQTAALAMTGTTAGTQDKPHNGASSPMVKATKEPVEVVSEPAEKTEL